MGWRRFPFTRRLTDGAGDIQWDYTNLYRSGPRLSKWAGYETYGARSARFRDLVEQARVQADDSVQARLRAELTSLAVEHRHQVVIGLVSEIFARELKMPSDQLDACLPLEYLGVDSLMATGIRVELDTRLGYPFRRWSWSAMVQSSGLPPVHWSRCSSNSASTSQPELHSENRPSLSA